MRDGYNGDGMTTRYSTSDSPRGRTGSRRAPGNGSRKIAPLSPRIAPNVSNSWRDPTQSRITSREVEVG